jgi:hypothetical protein
MKWLKGRKKNIVPKSFDEMRAWLDEREFVYEGAYSLDEPPEECPWQFAQPTEVSQIIGALFSPLEKNLPRTIAMLKERCVAMFAVQEDNWWYLLYVIRIELNDGKIGFTIFRGGEPINNPQLREEVRALGWDTPPELVELYRVHNGFGTKDFPNSFWNCVLSDNKLTVLSEYFSHPPNYLQGTFDYDLNDLLEFFPDGAGNGQFFYRKKGEPMLSVDWDHETRELSKPEEFWGFIDRMLSSVDEDRYDWLGRPIKK